MGKGTTEKKESYTPEKSFQQDEKKIANTQTTCCYEVPSSMIYKRKDIRYWKPDLTNTLVIAFFKSGLIVGYRGTNPITWNHEFIERERESFESYFEHV